MDALIERVDGARGPIAVAVTNSATHYVLSGYPEDLAAFGVEVAKEHKRQAKLREEKVRGGRVFDPTLEYLDVTLPFHSPLMADAVSRPSHGPRPAASTPTMPVSSPPKCCSTMWIGPPACAP